MLILYTLRDIWNLFNDNSIIERVIKNIVSLLVVYVTTHLPLITHYIYYDFQAEAMILYSSPIDIIY